MNNFPSDMEFKAEGNKIISREYQVCGNEPSIRLAPPSECPRDINIGRTPAAYIVTDNRGKRYLVFAGSVEHENAVMFNYDIKPLYE